MPKCSTSRIQYYDTSRGICYLLVSWIHATFFLMAFFPPEMFYYTNKLFSLGLHENIMWALSEQIAPTSFFILIGISIELSYKNKGETQKIRNYIFSRALFIFLISFIIKTSYLFGPLSSINDLSSDGKTAYILSGIFIALAFSLSGANLIRITLKKYFPFSYWKFCGLVGLALIILSACVEIYDETVDHYVNNLPVVQQSLIELLIISGKTGYFKCSFSLFPWLAYSLIGISYFHMTKKEGVNMKEVLFALLLIISFVAIHGFNNQGRIVISQLFIITKYPPSISLSLVSISFFLLLINFTRYIDTSIRNSNIINIISFLGKNTFFIYSVHFYFFALIGVLYKNYFGHYINSFLTFYIYWIGGTIALYFLTKLFVSYRKRSTNKFFTKYLLRYF